MKMASASFTVRQVDPGAAYRAHKEAIDAAIARVLDSGHFLLGREVAAFETEFAGWLGASHAVGCASGTDALVLLLRGLGVGPGSAVATVSHTSIATVAAIEMAGAVPLLLDVEPDHFTMDPHELAAALAHPPAGLPPIRAVVVVHLYGQPADMATLMPLCARAGVALIEDCSQAHGARHVGCLVGTLTEGAAFSFYPTKNLAAVGDAGLVTARDHALAERIAALRQYGWDEQRISRESGINARMDEMQAAILRVKLPALDEANQRRQAIAAAYDVTLAQSSIQRPARRLAATHVFHQYVVRTRARDALRAYLRERGVETAVHYALPVHRQPAYAHRIAFGPARCRTTDAIVPEILSLPMFPEMSDAELEHVLGALRAFWG
jgi:dTDP-4-amino-4,6-dideoxygalactose transaminase